MSKILVFGHQNPDTDAIGAAIAFSHLQNELGKETEAVALGTPNEETQYALDHFQLKQKMQMSCLWIIMNSNKVFQISAK